MNDSNRVPQQARPAPAGGFKPSQRTLIAGAVALALAGGAVLAQVNSLDTGPGLSQTQAQAPAMPSFADVAERVSPAVVNVMVVGNGVGSGEVQGLPDLPEGAPRDELFRHFFQQPGPSGPHHTQGVGSGFLVDADGYIVTNNHVIDGADEVRVTLYDGAKFKARVVGRDDKTDVALLKIDAGRPLPYVALNDSAKARVGDWVLAVGNPFGLGGSVNAGIVSAQGRDINSGPYDDYIQIDAPINRGNSGGPLFDAQGRVIGVNTAIYSPTGGNVGIGFAIPADAVRSVVAALRTDGRVARGWLGVEIQPVTDELASALRLKEPTGVLVAGVVPDGPAAHIDLKPGDVILSAGGQTIRDYKELPKLVAATKAGTPLTLEVVRNGEPRQVVAKVGAMPDDSKVADRSPDPTATAGPRLGLYLAPLTPELRREQGLDADATGVFVAKVEPNSPAERAGIEPGTLISMVGAQPVTTPQQVVAAVRKAAEEKQGTVLLRVQKDGNPLFVAVPFAA
jgi:serine protease Do